MFSGEKQLWRSSAGYRKQSIPESVRVWLLDAGSLTQRVKQACACNTQGGGFHMRVLRQCYQRPTLEEANVLGLRRNQLALIREAHLMCGDTPWVYARSVIPMSTLTGNQRRLAYLREKPLGAALFADRSMRRSAIEITQIKANARVLGGDVDCEKANKTISIWGRRSFFWLEEKPLLVAEYFLPAILERK